MAYIYRHIRLDINQPFYIGLGIQKWRSTTKRSRSQKWQEIIQSTDYEVEIILDNLTIEKAIEKEIEFIKLYGRIDLGTGTLVNLSKGGETGILEKGRPSWNNGRKATTYGWKKGQPAWNKGIKSSLEARKNLSLAKKGKSLTYTIKRKQADEAKQKPILMYNLKGEFIKEFEGVSLAARDMKLDCGAISKVANGKLKTTGGYIFKFK